MKVKPCPFCGSEYVKDNVEEIPNEIRHAHGFECQNCDICGPRKKTRLGALRAWNKRKFPTKKKGNLLLPCPFCGNEDIEVTTCKDYQWNVPGPGLDRIIYTWFIECNNDSCYFSIPSQRSKRKAIEMWNNRTLVDEYNLKAIKSLTQRGLL